MGTKTKPERDAAEAEDRIWIIFKTVTAKEGPWQSPPALMTKREAAQGCITGFVMGEPRWAEAAGGRFLYGMSARGISRLNLDDVLR